MPQVGGGHHQESDRERDRERGRKWRGSSYLASFVLYQKCPFLFIFPLYLFFKSPMNGITDKGISGVTQIYFGCTAIVYCHRTRGDLSGDNLVSIKDLNGFCGESREKFNLFLIYYSRYKKEKNWMADGLKIGPVPLLYPLKDWNLASYRLSSTPPPPPHLLCLNPSCPTSQPPPPPASSSLRVVTLNQLKK